MFVYCATNPSMPGLVKIGMTHHQPTARMLQLSNHTGVPTPFECAWFLPSTNPARDEAKLHKILAGHRVASRREFFRCTPEFARLAAQRAGLIVDNQLDPKSSQRKPVIHKDDSFSDLAGLAIGFLLFCAIIAGILWVFGYNWLNSFVGTVIVIAFLCVYQALENGKKQAKRR